MTDEQHTLIKQELPEQQQPQQNALKREANEKDPQQQQQQGNNVKSEADNDSPSATKRPRFEGVDRRDRRGTRNDNVNVLADEEEKADEPRLPKRKVAVQFGYCGIGYSGLQVNPGVKTIEGDIFDAFCKAGAVSKDNAVNPNKVGLQRAARTDRGVHAAGNILSLKLILEPPSLLEGQTLVEKVNQLLPPIIRIWGITRVQNTFNARTSCDSRMYEYLLPTYVFLPPKPNSAMWSMLKKIRDQDPSLATSLDEVIQHPFWEKHGIQDDFSEDVKAKKNWRIPSEHVDRIRNVFEKYTGSHNFHNFTVGKEFRDRSAQRFMKELSISEPKIIAGTEWLSIKFHGQSFMLHQIRKMIGLLVLVGRTNAPACLIPETYGPARIHIPKAPGLGLLLEEPLFGAYNSRIDRSNQKLDNLIQKDETRTTTAQEEKRDPVEFDQHKDVMQKFKQTFIYDRIMITEEETSEFAKWLNYLDVFQGPDFEFLNPKGIIPPTSILKVGEFRREQFSLNKKSDEDQEAQASDDDEDERQILLNGNKKNMDEYEG